MPICIYILYTGLEHPWILVSVGNYGPNPLRILRDEYNFRKNLEFLGEDRYKVVHEPLAYIGGMAFKT